MTLLVIPMSRPLFANDSQGGRVKSAFQEEMMSPVRRNKPPQAGKGHFLSKQINR